MSNNWLNKIRSHQETPPTGVWLYIANELDNESENASANLKARILNYEVAPPSGSLQNIFDVLESETIQQTPKFVSRLQQYTQEPPSGTWEKILQQLDNTEGKIVSFNNRKNKQSIYLKMAAAASVIAVITTALFLLNNKSEDNSDNTIAVVAPETNKVNVPKTEQEKITLPASDSQENKLQQTATTNSLKQKNQQPVEISIPELVNNNETADLALDPVTINKEKLQNANGETPVDIALLNTPNTYISITGPDGQTVKVSSKFSNLLGYLTDKNPDTRENIDIIIQESAIWKEKFAQWRDKMTNNSVAPSFTNFLDIIELSKVLEDKK